MAPKRVSPKEALSLMENEGYVYIDVRSVPEFDAGHPEGAYNIPLMHMSAAGMQPNGDYLAVVSALFAPDTAIVVGCKAGGRSLRAAEMMLVAGFTNVVDQRAGFSGATSPFGQVMEEGWSQAQLPVTVQAVPERTWAALEAKAKAKAKKT